MNMPRFLITATVIIIIIGIQPFIQRRREVKQGMRPARQKMQPVRQEMQPEKQKRRPSMSNLVKAIIAVTSVFAFAFIIFLAMSAIERLSPPKTPPSRESVYESTQTLPDTSETPYTKGISTDTGYRSDYLNLQFSVPDGYVMVSEEYLEQELRKTNKLGENAKIDYAKVFSIPEMTAVTPDGTVFMSIDVEKRTMPMSDYLEKYKASMRSSLPIESVDDEVTTVEIAGKTYWCISYVVNSTLEDGYLTVGHSFFSEQDARVVIILGAAPFGQEAELDFLLSQFTAIR